MKEIYLIGAGGHCKIVIDLISYLDDYKICGIYDDKSNGNFCNIDIIGKVNDIENEESEREYFICIGNDNVRKDFSLKFNKLRWATLIHPTSIISKTAKIDDGTLVCAGSIIQTEVDIGKQCIINTGSIIDHESKIGNYCSICPKATLCGRVNIGEKTFVGAGAIIIQCKNIGNNCIIGAGSVIIRNLDDNLKVVGNPARLI